MGNSKLFTSESVSNGHPDKIADQISDAILDDIIAQDKSARVACETVVKNGMVLLAGEITTSGWCDFDNVVRNTIHEIGYDDAEIGFNATSCSILSVINTQSHDIEVSVNTAADDNKEHGAGDQGMMFGYACNETAELMPLPILYASKLMQRHAYVRENKLVDFLRPDAKSQITVRYEGYIPICIETVLISTQHKDNVSNNMIREAVIEEIIKPVIPEELISKDMKIIVNPSGRFVIGGPIADCGLTGRKIIVDTYGGMARHGGGAFSGKDPTKVDRSAAYMARYVAKNIVASGVADRCELQISYGIGLASPISLYINCFGTNKIPEDQILELVKQHFNMMPDHIIKTLDLLRPIYKKTAAFGHFGREESAFTWEKTDKAKNFM